MSHRVAALIAIGLLAGCPGPLPACPQCANNDDLDGDRISPAGGDCDDTDPDVYPGAVESCDQLDNDCDGAVDEDFDADGDGYPDAEAADCAAADALDCDDSRADVFPGAAEACDGADNDCDGAVDEDFDADGDGYPDAEAADCAAVAALDCDDSDAEVSPASAEVCDDQIDNNCDEADNDGCRLGGEVALRNVDGVLRGSGASGAGKSLALIGDLDGDGVSDVVASAPGVDHTPVFSSADGTVYLLLSSALTGSEQSSLDTVSGGSLFGSNGQVLGFVVAAGADLSGDGEPDIVASIDSWSHDVPTSTGGVLILPASVGLDGLDAQDNRHAEIQGGTPQLGLGLGMATGFDYNNDGQADLLLGAPTPLLAGEAYLFFGPITEDLDAQRDADIIFPGEASSSAGHALLAADLDSDGATELLIGADHADPKGINNAGALHVIDSGVAAAEQRLEDDALTFIGESSGASAGRGVAAADLDGDGHTDLLIAAPGAEEPGGAEVGAVYLFRGPAVLDQSEVIPDSADATIYGDEADSAFGWQIVTPDLDQDGVLDLVISAPDRSAGSLSEAGGVAVLYGGVGDGTYTVADDAAAILVGEGAAHGAGMALLPTDMSGDGYPDLLIGAPWEGAEVIYTILGGSY